MTNLPPFIKGMDLSRLYFCEAVQPILDQYFPDLPYSAGRLDYGSDVLGFDTPMSRDHDWGPRLMLFVQEADLDRRREAVLECLSEHLPKKIHGYSTHFGPLVSGDAGMQPWEQGPLNPYITVISPERFFLGYAGVDITRPMTAADWLVIPWQRLATIQSGGIFHDGLNRLAELQARLRWYPHDVWLYALAAQWRHIDQEEPFMGRTGDVGDELGSRVLAARLVNRLMQLCFLLARRWPPYSKWFGTAFSQLDCAPVLQPLFLAVIEASDWKSREKVLSEIYIHTIHIHNKANIIAYLAPEILPFHSRPYQVPHSSRFVDALQGAIRSAEVLALPPYVGSIDQFVGSTDVLESIALCRHLKHVYQNPLTEEIPDTAEWLDIAGRLEVKP
jgi:hypothetical protein